MIAENTYEINWNVDTSSYPREDIEQIEQRVLRYSEGDKEVSVSSGFMEYQYNFKVFPDTKKIDIDYLVKFKFFNWKKDFRQDENIVFVNAQSDFVSYMILDHVSGLPMGTSLWLVHQSIEKYLKALLLKTGNFDIDALKRRPYGHSLERLLEEYRIVNQDSLIFEDEDYEILIKELDSGGDNTGVRYSGGFHINEPFTRILLEICTILRFDFLGLEKFTSSNPFGLGGNGNNVTDIILKTYSKYRVSDSFLRRVQQSQSDD